MRKTTRRIKTPPRSRAKSGSEKTRTTRAGRSTTVAGSKKARKPTEKKTFDRGAEGFQKARKKRQRQEAEYERRKNTPFDFRLKPGDEAEVVILDSEPPYFISMHKVKSNGRWIDEVCIADKGERCPLCDSLNKEGSFTMYLTVLDRRPYTIKSGPNQGKTIKSSRKLFPVKGRNLPKFERQYKRNKGNLRGLRVMCSRTGEKEAAIGEDLEFRGKVSEKALAKYGESSQPVNYEEIFTIPTAKELIKRHNLDVQVAGSEEFGGDDDDGDESYSMDEVEW